MLESSLLIMRLDVGSPPNAESALRWLTTKPDDANVGGLWKGPYLDGAVPMDPWNNPYWIQYSKKTKRGIIYSFGPNRRRDLVVRDPKSDPGDDVVVRFTFAGSADAGESSDAVGE